MASMFPPVGMLIVGALFVGAGIRFFRASGDIGPHARYEKGFLRDVYRLCGVGMFIFACLSLGTRSPRPEANEWAYYTSYRSEKKLSWLKPEISTYYGPFDSSAKIIQDGEGYAIVIPAKKLRVTEYPVINGRYEHVRYIWLQKPGGRMIGCWDTLYGDWYKTDYGNWHPPG